MQLIHQKPCPRINIYSPDSKATPKLTFDISNISSLQSYSFSLSTDDISGSFNLMFFPDNVKTTTAAGEAKTEALFDKIELLDIVLFYEDYIYVNRASGEKANIEGAYPIFTGIIRSKKYAATGSEAGVMRRMSVSGTAITGLVSQFKISLDVTAQAANTIVSTNDAFNAWFVQTNKENGNVEIKDVILTAWDLFLQLNTDTGNPTIADYITKWMGEPSEFFDIDSMTLGYPMAGIFQHQSTQDFFSITDQILPPPYYEKSAYADSEGKMKIRLRKCPFSANDWQALEKNKVTIDNARVKSFDVAQSDNEVYTIFLAYLEGSAISEQTYLITAINDAKKKNELQKDATKFDKYGYRPLIVHFRGYRPPTGKDSSEADSSVENMMATATSQIATWYANLDEMLSGSITLAMTYRNDTDRIMPGDVVDFLGCEFYVDGITHSWTYNGGGEISLSVSRGGEYNNGVWQGVKDITAYSNVRA